MLQDDPELIYGSDVLRAQRLEELKSLGVDIVKVRVRWRDLAPKKKPAGFDGSSPNSYPASAWAPYDAVVSGASDRGMGVMFQLGGTAPDWATPGKSPVNNPNASEFGKFVHAVGTRYPTVKIWSVWNEPNLASWLSPQVKGGVPQAPRIYRGLLNAASSALASTGHASDDLLYGELLPFTRSSRESSKKIRPLNFLRELACVDSHYRAFRGTAAKRRGCANFKALPGTGLAYHPYTLAGGPNVRTPNKNDASIRDLGRISRVLAKLRAKKRLSRPAPIWITEFGFQSRPPDPYATPLKKIPGFMGQSEFIAFKNRHVVSFSQYPLVDDAGKTTGFQSGLRFHSGKKKPGVFAAFQRPFYARQVGGASVELFGGVRALSSGTVELQTRTSKKGKWQSLGTAPLNSRGYFDKRVKLSRLSKRYFRFLASGMPASRVAKAARH